MSGSHAHSVSVNWISSTENSVLRGQRDSARREFPLLPESDVDGPVAAAGLAKLSRPIQRVNDPHPWGREPEAVVPALFREHRVTGPKPSQRSH